MCGICGYITKTIFDNKILREMNDTLVHRGPDDYGEEIYKFDQEKCIGLAHRRLSIMDLSPLGHQPMHSNDKNVIVIFNGEIYNFNELKKELNEYHFYSDCDTEVIIAAYQKWGVHFVDKLNGMFAIALFDVKQKKLFLLRDRIGKKPLYYYYHDEELVWASELKAIMKYPGFSKEINYGVIGRYLQKMYINAPDTIFLNTFKLEPGGVLEYCNGKITTWKYWDVARVYKEKRKELITDYEEAKVELEKIITNAIIRRLYADVPVGAFLSGGIDSSLVCAIAQKKLNHPLKTFSIGFDDSRINEMEYANEISKILGTDHTEYKFGEMDLLNLVDSIPIYYDEPNGDNSQIPTMLVSQLARKSVTVAITGDGGDEIFGGYNIYSTLQKAQNRLNESDKSAINQLCHKNNILLEEKILAEFKDENTRTQVGIQNYIDYIANLLDKPCAEYYFPWEKRYEEKDWSQRRMLLDLDTYLPDDILAKVDRASMKYALECRCPLLDQEVLEYSFRLPISYKDNNGNQKRILKDLVYQYIPKKMLDRPKMGFGMPMYRWLSGPLKERIIDYSSESFLRRQGIFNGENLIPALRDYLQNGDESLNKGKNYTNIFWSYFVFQMWYEKYMN